MKEVYLVAAKRTAIGNFMGSLAKVSAVELGREVVKSLITSTQINSDDLSEMIMGQVILGANGQNPARQTLIKSGINYEVPAYTVGIVCGSGLLSVMLGCQAIKSGDAKLIIAGGQENMSLANHASYIRSGHKMGNLELVDMMTHDGLRDAFSGKLMGVTAENIARKYNITRKMQDEYALNSQRKAAEAIKAGCFDLEIVPILIKNKKEEVEFKKDEFVRDNLDITDLEKLKPAFEDNGTVTAGNSSGINDGAAALMLADEEMIKKYSLEPIARIVSYGKAGVNPDIMGTGPIPASKIALSKANWSIKDLDLIESNEAFAAQAIAVNQEMGWDTNKVNIRGGAIAIGHPIGASGARVLVTLLHALKAEKLSKGIATLCIGGGMGVAICVEMV